METRWLMEALNHPAGQLAQFWIKAVSADWKEAGDNWAGLPTEMRSTLDSMLEGSDSRTAMVETIFASQLLFFFGADREWCQNRVLPLFDWDNPDKARRAWDGFLMWGRFNDPLLETGVLDRYLETAAHHTNELRDETRNSLYQHLAVIALASGIDTLSWIDDFTARVDEASREKWIKSVTHQLTQLPAGGVEIQWQRWMREYWRKRIKSIPRRLTKPEASAMASWIVELEDPVSIEEGVDLATSHPARIQADTDLLYQLAQGKLATAPAAFGKLVAHLLGRTQQPFAECYHLAKIVPQLRKGSQSDTANTIVTEAIRLGCRNASHW